MTIRRCLSWSSFGSGLMVLAFVFAGSPSAAAQAQPPCTKGQGFNAVYGNCTNGSPNGSFNVIDASQYVGQGGDICQAINAILVNYNGGNSYGIVVDARGVSPLQNCSMNPWSNLTTQPSSSVLLLPPGTITLSAGTTWTVPANTRIVGQGPNVTVLQAGSGFSGYLINMGTSSLCGGIHGDCPSIQVAHLGLNGNNFAGVGGILNSFSQELGYVNDVWFSNIAGIALDVETNQAANSGPYTNLTMSNVGTCLQIKTNSTRGVQGLTCTTNGSNTPAVYLDGIGNSLADIYIQGGSTQDGILVGSQAAAGNNLLFNITGLGVANVVELSANLTAGVPNVSDVTILGLSRSGGTGTIRDDLVNKTIGDAKVGMYVIGEPVQGNGLNIGYSRFTTSTSTNAVTWLVGPNAPVNGCATGDLFSQTTAGGANKTLWGCGGGAWYQIM